MGDLDFRVMLIALIVISVSACGQSDPTSERRSVSKEPLTEQTEVRKLERIGVQLYTLRTQMEADFEGTLRRVAEIGYDEVEFAGFFGNDPADVRELLDELNLTPVASHVNWEGFKNDPAALIEETAALGAPYMILAWLPPEERESLAQWEVWIERLNAAGAMAHERGITMAFHNHDFEFIEVDGVKPYDLIMQKIDRRYVKLELDLYWISLVGEDPANYFAQYKDGFPLSHVKDMAASTSQMADVGAGDIDFAKIFKQAETVGMKHFIVEHDDAPDPFASIEASLTYLRALEY